MAECEYDRTYRRLLQVSSEFAYLGMLKRTMTIDTRKMEHLSDEYIFLSRRLDGLRWQKTMQRLEASSKGVLTTSQ